MKTSFWHHHGVKTARHPDPRYQFRVPDPKCEPVERNELMNPAPYAGEGFKPQHVVGVILLSIALFLGMRALWQYNDRELEKARVAHPEQFQVPPE